MEDLATDLTLQDTATRLSRLILRHVNHGDIHEKLQLINDLSHEELANMIGSVRNVVGRHMMSLKKDGVIDAKRKKLQIKDIQSLLDRAKNAGSSTLSYGN